MAKRLPLRSCIAGAAVAGLILTTAHAAEKGIKGLLDSLVVAAENRCSVYDRKSDYQPPAALKWEIAKGFNTSADAAGRLAHPIPSPYRANEFVRSLLDVDIEHIVAPAEAHDSGLCARSTETRAQFAHDLLNLTLSTPSERHEKSGQDAAEWLPAVYRCWYVKRIILVKARYSLTVDPAEDAALRRVLRECG